ncbi:Dps family protein [Roseitranquillus sediminis]|uniref:Dps family protein n=1 Tax=Roseitranquillus sediminis TaxID=2809051 RepID=UPI001D0CD8BD|nr:DNA starvation/stationary phase protection protein [Roseitranquillus sediminis]MBM9593493.1 DNA starvation/stationary phase protection protein [Roseitranquillus sediminis]
MTDSLKVVPSEDEVRTGVTATAGIATGLANVLADTYRLLFKTHGYHWNVEGPLFYSIHKLTEEQYEDMFAAADELAERIRALGHLAPIRMAEIVERSVIEDPTEMPSAGRMVEDLARDHERVAHRLHALIKLSEDERDDVTADLAVERSAFHEKAAWMLRAIAAQ